jgi:hypothetical protein
MAPLAHNSNPNMTDLRKFKGPVRICEHCRPEDNLLGKSCIHCYSQGYLATCLMCSGTGKTTSGSVWDGGASSYTATCGICGGKGSFPARANDFHLQAKPQTAPMTPTPVNMNTGMAGGTQPQPAVVVPHPPMRPTEVPPAIKAMDNLVINRRIG